MDYVLSNGQALLPDASHPEGVSIKTADIGVEGGKIVAIGDLSQRKTQKRIDVTGLHVLPGVIDSQVHFREPGAEHKEDLESGTRAALMGGVTTIFEMPNTNPSTTTKEALEDKLKRAADRAHCNYAFFVGACPENISEMHELEKLPGACGVKIFMGSSTGTLLVEREDHLYKILENGQRRVSVHCEDEDRLRERLKIAQDSKSVFDHPVWRDETAALEATQRLVKASQKTGRKINTLHITTKEEIEFLHEAKKGNPQITVECTPQHLTLSAPDCYERLGTFAQMNPPIRSEEHRKALWEGIANGTVDVIGSDHAPHTKDEKAKEYPSSPSGMPGVQTLVPLMLNHVANGELSLERFTKLVTKNPASMFDLKNKGEIQIGYDADLTVVDLAKETEIEESWLQSKCEWSPFTGKKVTGWPIGAFIAGHMAMWEGEIVSPHIGRICEFNV